MSFCTTCGQQRKSAVRYCTACGTLFDPAAFGQAAPAFLGDTRGQAEIVAGRAQRVPNAPESPRGGTTGRTRRPPVSRQPGSPRWGTRIVVIAVVLIAAAGGTTAWLIYHHHTRSTVSPLAARRSAASQRRTRPAANSAAASSTSSAGNPALTSTPSPTSSAPLVSGPTPTTGMVELAPAVAGDPRAPIAEAFVDHYFTAINNHDFRQYLRLLNPMSRRNETAASFYAGYRTTNDSNATITAISAVGDGRMGITVTFTSHQRPSDGPTGTACINWNITLYLQNYSGRYLLGPAPVGYEAIFNAC
jgi:hypothetical protein